MVAICFDECSDAGICLAHIEPHAFVVCELPQYHFASRARVFQPISVPHLPLSRIHDCHALPCESVRMRFDFLKAISSSDNAGGMMRVVVGVRDNGMSSVSGIESNLCIM